MKKKSRISENSLNEKENKMDYECLSCGRIWYGWKDSCPNCGEQEEIEEIDDDDFDDDF